MLAILVLVALIHHILIFHPFMCQQSHDEHGLLWMYDTEVYSEAADDGDTLSISDRRGILSPVLAADSDIDATTHFHPLLLNAAVEHPPKT